MWNEDCAAGRLAQNCNGNCVCAITVCVNIKCITELHVTHNENDCKTSNKVMYTQDMCSCNINQHSGPDS
jgi:hypothetical protein